jgi:hypothetical protein
MNISHTDIVNMSIQMVGGKSIHSLTDETDRSTEALACRVHYPLTRRAVFRSHPWNCISKQADLGATTGTPLWGYSYIYAKPADYIRLIRFSDHRAKWRILGDKIYATCSYPYIEYVWACEDSTKYDELLIETMVCALAVAIAIPVSGQPEKVQSSLEKFKQIWEPIARTVDAMENSQEIIQTTTLMDELLYS